MTETDDKKFTLHVSEETHRVERRERCSAVIGGYLVCFSYDEQTGSRISVSPKDYTSSRLGILEFSPKSVSDLETLADAAGPLLRELAAQLRAIGKEDLRSSFDRVCDKAGFAGRRVCD